MLNNDDYSDFEEPDYSDFEEDDEAKMQAESVCPICLERPEVSDAIDLTCRHQTCLSCLGGWLRSLVQSRRLESLSCPMCRCRIDDAIVHRVLQHEDDGSWQLYRLLQEVMSPQFEDAAPVPNHSESSSTRSSDMRQSPLPRPHMIPTNHPALQAVEQALRDELPLPDVLQAVARARFHQLHILLQASVLEVVRRAESARELGSLRNAVVEGRLVGLSPDALATAEHLLMEDDRHRARVAIRKAADRRDRTGLREALATGRAVGLPHDELLQAEALLRGERMRRAREEIQKSMNNRSIGPLYRAIVEAKAAGLETLELEAAEALLEDLRVLRAPRERVDFRERHCRWRPSRSKGRKPASTGR